METFPMIKKYVLIALGLCVAAASCAKGPTPAREPSAATTDASGKTEPAAVADAKPNAKANSKSDAPKPAAPAAPSIPAGAELTSYCITVPGPGPVVQSTQLRDQLVKGTGMRDWYVIHGEGESTLYYGFYKAMDKAKPTREKIDAMKDVAGTRPFRNAMIVELTAPDPDAPPQWDL